MKKFSKLNENLNNIKKVEGTTITYFSLFELLDGLESERPGIRDRVWDFLCDEKDSSFKVYNRRIKNMNLFYYGIGDEYPLKYNHDYPGEVERSKTIHPDAFLNYIKPGSGDKKIQDLRIDFNLIWYVYEDQIEDPESFPVITKW